VWAPTLGRRWGWRHLGLAIDMSTKSSDAKCPQLRPSLVFVLFSSSRDLKTVTVIGAVGCVDRCRQRRSGRTRTCGHPGCSTGGQIKRPVDGFRGSLIHPQASPVVPTTVPRLRPTCTQPLRGARPQPNRPDEGCARTGDHRGVSVDRMWISCGPLCGVPVDSLWTLCGAKVVVADGRFARLWGDCAHRGDAFICATTTVGGAPGGDI
jgi:hypothetical protein